MKNYCYSIGLHIIILLLLFLVPLTSTVKVLNEEKVIILEFSQQAELISLSPLNTAKTNQSTQKPVNQGETKASERKPTTSEARQTSQKPLAKASATSRLVQEVSEVQAKPAHLATSDGQSSDDNTEKELADKKSMFKSLFSNIHDTPASEATETKDKSGNGSNISSQSTTSGVTGNAIGNRRVLFTPTIKDDSQKKGKVAVKICVNADGKVISTEYTQSGSTTSDVYLVKLALEGAAKYIFSPSDNAKECGKVVVDFQLR